MRNYYNVHEAYLKTLKDVLENPDCISSPRGQRVLEKFNYQFTITKPTVESIVTNDLERNVVIADYSNKEFLAYNSTEPNLKERAKLFFNISSFWKKLVNPDGTLNSDYGYLVFMNKSSGSDHEVFFGEHPQFGKDVKIQTPMRRTPWDWAKMCLRKDKDTRQSILRFSLPEHQWDGNRDQVCTLHGVFSIRDDKLNLTINMRSNDLLLGLVYDLPWFISLMYKMRIELIDIYPNLEIGEYTHYVHNIHIYERDIAKVQKMIGE